MFGILASQGVRSAARPWPAFIICRIRHGGPEERTGSAANRGLTGKPKTRSKARSTPASATTFAVCSFARRKKSVEHRYQIELIVIESVMQTMRLGFAPFAGP